MCEAPGSCRLGRSIGLGTQNRSLTMSTGKYPKLVPVLILIQTDGTDIILISWERERILSCWESNLRKLTTQGLFPQFFTPVQTLGLEGTSRDKGSGLGGVGGESRTGRGKAFAISLYGPRGSKSRKPKPSPALSSFKSLHLTLHPHTQGQKFPLFIFAF